MVLKVNVNLPENIELLTAKTTETVAKILVNKLNTTEMEQLISFLQKDEIEFNL